MVIPNFVDQALDGRPITIFGDGSQSRCFTHVNDVVGALMGLIAHPDAVGEVYNIGATTEVTIEQLAERIRHLTGSESPIVKIPYDEAYEGGFEDMQRRMPSIEKISRLIGYQPTYTLDQILLSVIQFRRG
jgi:UDP-glucose 4-epimerase